MLQWNKFQGPIFLSSRVGWGQFFQQNKFQWVHIYQKNLGGSIFIMTWPRKHNYVCSEEPGTVVRRAVLLNTSRAGRCKMFHMYSIAYQSSYLLEHSGVARSWQLVGHKYRLAQINAAEVMLIQGALQHRTRIPTRAWVIRLLILIHSTPFHLVCVDFRYFRW